MTGYQGSAQDIVLYTNQTDPELNAFVADLISTYQPGMVQSTSTCGYPCSDHASWDARNYRAAFPFEAPWGQSSPYIHTSSDTVANLSNGAAHAAKFARLAAAFLVETAIDGPEVPAMPFLDGFETADTSAWSQTFP
jgi:leucyl aminopeptidase